MKQDKKQKRIKLKPTKLLNRPSKTLKLARGCIMYVSNNYVRRTVHYSPEGVETGKTTRIGVSKQYVYQELRKAPFCDIQVLRLAYKFQILTDQMKAEATDHSASEAAEYLAAIIKRADEIEAIRQKYLDKLQTGGLKEYKKDKVRW